MEKQYEVQSDAERHECVSWLENNHIFFRCTQCSFIRKIDMETGLLSVVKTGNPYALHKGSHQPLKKSMSTFNQN
jgi:hypothetical protein